MSRRDEHADAAGLRATIGALQAQNATLRQLVTIHDRLGALVLQGADVAAITRMLAELVGRRVLLLDGLLQVVTMAVPAADARQAAPTGAGQAQSDERLPIAAEVLVPAPPASTAAAQPPAPAAVAAATAEVGLRQPASGAVIARERAGERPSGSTVDRAATHSPVSGVGEPLARGSRSAADAQRGQRLSTDAESAGRPSASGAGAGARADADADATEQRLSRDDEPAGRQWVSAADASDGRGAATAAADGLPDPDAFTWRPRPGYVRAVLATLARERRPLRVPPMLDLGVPAGAVLAPVAVGDSSLGYLAILAEGADAAAVGEDLDLQIVQHAATVYALSMMRERMVTDVAHQLKDELFEGLLIGRTQDEQVARERAVRLGYRPDSVYRVLVLTAVASAPDADARPETIIQRRRLMDTLIELCARRAPEALATVRDEQLVVLVPQPISARELGRTALQQAAALLPAWQVAAGVGGACGSAAAIASSYAQARRAIETARRFGRHGDVFAFEDLGVYRLLYHVTDPAELRGFTDQILGPLIDYDQRHNAELVGTLRAFLGHNGNVQATARELSLHVNSVAYRLQRIQAITSLDLEQAEDRLEAQVALKILAGL